MTLQRYTFERVVLPRSMWSPRHDYVRDNYQSIYTVRIYTSPGNYRYLKGEPTPRKKSRKNRTHACQPKGAELRPSFERAQAKRAHLKVALLAERHAHGPDGQHMRSPQLARCSRDQIRLRMAALARG